MLKKIKRDMEKAVKVLDFMEVDRLRVRCMSWLSY